MPSIIDSQDPWSDLQDYVSLYPNEEIKAESLVRNFTAFHKFLMTATLSNSKQINFSNIGNDSQVPPRTVHDYFQILDDTLIGFMLLPFKESNSRKVVSSSKFYFFDTGVLNAIIHRKNVTMNTPEFGELFEHFIVKEVRAYISYKQKNAQMFYWRSLQKHEVDIVVKNENEILAFEVKAKSNITQSDQKNLDVFKKDYPGCKSYIINLNGKHFVQKDGLEVIPCFEFLEMLWNGEIF